MEAPFAVAVVEAAQIPYGAYLRLHGRVSEKRAPILLSGSLEQDIGWYPSLIERWESPASWEKTTQKYSVSSASFPKTSSTAAIWENPARRKDSCTRCFEWPCTFAAS